MTEPVRDPLPTHTPLGPVGRLCAGVLAMALALTLPVSVHAAPGEPASPASESGELPDESQVRAALSDGDLTTARELAVARREAMPSATDPQVEAEAWQLEAEVWLALGDYQHAKLALESALDALPDDASERDQLLDQLAEIEARSRGTKSDEPASSHRESIDQTRADRLAALAPKPLPAPLVIDEPQPVSIAKKWYFWVTLGTIVASAGAIAGIAISSAVDDRNSTNAGTASATPSTMGRQLPAGGVMFRF